MTSTPSNQPQAQEDLQSLREENAELRAQLARARQFIEFQRNRRFELSKMLKVGFWEWNEVTNKPISYSPEMAHVLGMDEARIDKQFRNPEAYKRILHPDDLRSYQQNLDSRALLQPGVSRMFDYRILVDRREIRYIREYEQGVFDENGKLVSSFGMLQDVTEAQLAVAALRESEERYHSLFEQMPLGVQEEDYSAIKKFIDKLRARGVADIEQYFLDNPRKLRELVGHTRITSVNQTLIGIHNASSREQFLAVEADVDGWWGAQWVEYYAAEIGALAGEEKVYSADRIDSRVDGENFETRSLVTLVSGYEDTWERVITIHEDITERKQAEADLIEAMNQAERANRAKSEFLSNMSHELRTPLNAILGFAQLFDYDRELGEQHLANATEIRCAARHLMSLIDQILDLSRIEAGETDISLEPVALERVLGDSIRWIDPLARQRRIAIEYDAASVADVAVVADSIRLKQVFLNLLSNAVKYNRDGGRVQVLFEPLDDASIRVGIRDTGKGISAEKLKELFQPFNRLGAEFSGVEGSGIGLVIARQLVGQMQGELDIESEVGVGSTFGVRLRLAPTAAPRAGAAGRTPAVSGDHCKTAKARILVAEDNEINQELMAAQLDLLGYRADFAADGNQALACWQSGDYRLLLTDIRMPEMNGYQLVREIRELERNGVRRTSVIAITANALETDVEKCFAAGVDDVIAKPVELEDLRDALDKWMVDEVIDDRPASMDGTPPGAPAGADPAANPVDFDVLAQSTGDNPALHCSLLQSYRDALGQEVDHLQRAHAGKNGEQLLEYSHKLKSSSRSLGVTAMAEACEALESAARQQRWENLEILMPQVRETADLTLRSIEAYLQEQAEAGQPL